MECLKAGVRQDALPDNPLSSSGEFNDYYFLCFWVVYSEFKQLKTHILLTLAITLHAILATPYKLMNPCAVATISCSILTTSASSWSVIPYIMQPVVSWLCSLT